MIRRVKSKDELLGVLGDEVVSLHTDIMSFSLEN